MFFSSHNIEKKKKNHDSLSQLAYCSKIRGFWKHLIYFAFSLYLNISSWRKAYLAIGKPEINSRTLFMLSLKTKGSTKKKKDAAKLNWTLFRGSQWAVTLLRNQTWPTHPCAEKHISSHQVLMKGNIAFIVGHQARTGSSWLKDPNSLGLFRRDFKSSMKEGTQGLWSAHNSQIGWHQGGVSLVGIKLH